MKITIIGAGSGLSRSIAKLFGENGFDITLVARTESKLQEEINFLHDFDINAQYLVTDISNNKSFSDLLESLKIPENLPDVIVFNAFINRQESIENETWESLKNQMDTNVGAAFTLTKTLLPEYINANKGTLLFTGGGLGIEPQSDFVGVSMSKAALRNFVLLAAQTTKNTNVHIGTVTVKGAIGGDDPFYDPDLIAQNFWKLYEQQPMQFETEIIY